MNQIYLPNDSADVFQALHIPDFGITWAGANPFGEGFCLGSETGQLVFTDTKGALRSRPVQASASGEAINGFTFSNGWLAATTRKDINLLAPVLLNKQDTETVVISGGALDVVAAPSGYFVLPLGRSGVMFIKPGMKEDEPVTIGKSGSAGLNFCRVIALNGDNGKDLIVGAGRRGGVSFADFQEGMRGQILHTVAFPELDFVDVCSIGTPEHSKAVAAAGRDGSLVLFRDIKTDKKPLALKFRGVAGTLYRVLSIGGDIYLLTSQGLFALFLLADRFLKGQAVDEFITNVLKLPIEAADANMVDQKWLLAAGVDDLFKLDVQRIPKSPEVVSRQPKDITVEPSWGKPHETVPDQLDMEPHWDESGFEQSSENLAPAL